MKLKVKENVRKKLTENYYYSYYHFDYMKLVTENNEWFLDDAGQLEFQGVQVGAAVRKHIHTLHSWLSRIYFYVSIIHFARNFFISRIIMLKNYVRHSYNESL